MLLLLDGDFLGCLLGRSGVRGWLRYKMGAAHASGGVGLDYFSSVDTSYKVQSSL